MKDASLCASACVNVAVEIGFHWIGAVHGMCERGERLVQDFPLHLLADLGVEQSGALQGLDAPPFTKSLVRSADRGIGIGPADLPHVFDPYFTTKRGGTGLGLPIAKNIVEGLGGTIGVTSSPGRGTEIRIELSA